MKTQEYLSFRTTPNTPLRIKKRMLENSSRISNNKSPWNVTVKTKHVGFVSHSPGHIGSRHGPLVHQSPHRWGLVLAGGDGLRLRDLTRWVCGDDRPKQFCPLLDKRTLVEATQQRAKRSLPADHICVALTRTHEPYYRDLIHSSSSTIVQPFNRGTAPAILGGLMHIARKDPDAVVAILPSDHYYWPETGFTSALDAAMEVAEQRTDSVVLLGAPPKGPEVEYGWIQLGEAVRGQSGLFLVQGFREKPPRSVAETLYKQGCLWNMFVMAGRVQAFLEIASRNVKDVLSALQSHATTWAGESVIEIPDSAYKAFAPVDFSSRVLTSDTEHLLALRMENVEWNDLGDPYRVLVTLVERDGELPPWAKLWSEPGDDSQTLAATA